MQVSTEKAGVGGSIPSLATIKSTTWRLRKSLDELLLTPLNERVFDRLLEIFEENQRKESARLKYSTHLVSACKSSEPRGKTGFGRGTGARATAFA